MKNYLADGSIGCGQARPDPVGLVFQKSHSLVMSCRWMVGQHDQRCPRPDLQHLISTKPDAVAKQNGKNMDMFLIDTMVCATSKQRHSDLFGLGRKNSCFAGFTTREDNGI
jgi:hypothetical protein